MTTTMREKAERGRTWPAVGLLSLGAAAIMVGPPWTWPSDDGRTRPTTTSRLDSGYEVAISRPGKKTEAFRAPTANAAHVWLGRRNEELKHLYHLKHPDVRAVAGRLLSPLGIGLAAAAGGVLILGSAKLTGRRSAADGETRRTR